MKKLFIILAICLLLISYSSVFANHEDDFALIAAEDLSDQSMVTIMLDHVTGVEYIVYRSNDKISICPRYNSDGSLYCIDQD